MICYININYHLHILENFYLKRFYKHNIQEKPVGDSESFTSSPTGLFIAYVFPSYFSAGAAASFACFSFCSIGSLY